MSEVTKSGWDRLQYPYGLLNIKGGAMPSYPNFVRGNLKLTKPSCYASLNMTSEITPFFNSRLEVINVKKFIEDGGIKILEKDKTYVIKMPKLIKKINGLSVIRYQNCEWLVTSNVTYEYTYYIRPLSLTRMSLNLEKYDKNDDIKPWPESKPLTQFTVAKFQSFSSGNNLDTITMADSQMYCWHKQAHKLQNIRKPDIFASPLLWHNGGKDVSYNNHYHDIFVAASKIYNFSRPDMYSVHTLKLIDTPLKIFTEEKTLELINDAQQYEFKFIKGNCASVMIINTTTFNSTDKTAVPHTLTAMCTSLNKLGGELNITPIQYLFNSMFKFENVDNSLAQTTPGLIIIPLLNVHY